MRAGFPAQHYDTGTLVFFRGPWLLIPPMAHRNENLSSLLWVTQPLPLPSLSALELALKKLLPSPVQREVTRPSPPPEGPALYPEEEC